MAASRGAAGTWTPEAAVFAAMERRLDEMAREMVRVTALRYGLRDALASCRVPVQYKCTIHNS